MRFSKPKQFWAWFQRNQRAYANLLKMDKRETLYLMRELSIHLRACGRYIEFELVFQNKKPGADTVCIFTANGRHTHFTKVERLIAEAPAIPGWHFCGLMPPRTAGFQLESDFPEISFNPALCWFLPPVKHEPTQRWVVCLYMDTYEELTIEHADMARQVVYNLLGEKVYGWMVYDVGIDRLCELPRAMHGELIGLEHLSDHIYWRDTTGMIVDKDGNMTIPGL